MMLTDSNNIKVKRIFSLIEIKYRLICFQEVLLFPACKPYKEGEENAAKTEGGVTTTVTTAGTATN